MVKMKKNPELAVEPAEILADEAAYAPVYEVPAEIPAETPAQVMVNGEPIDNTNEE